MAILPPDDKRSLLICEDSTELLKVIVELVATMGLDVDTAADGVEAAELIARRPYDAILSDLNMPNKSGVELLTELRARGDDTPFIFISGYGDRSLLRAAMVLGAWDFVDKPWQDDELLQILARAVDCGLRRRRLRASLANPEHAGNALATVQRKRDEQMIALLQVVNQKRRA